MAHILDGDWTSSTVSGTTLVPDRPGPMMPNILHLEIDEATGDLKPASMHGPNALTGRITPLGQRHVVEINNLNRNRRYEGVLCAEVRKFGGAVILVIAGKLRVNVQFDRSGNPTREAVEPKDEKYSKEADALLAQDQEIWVATKP
jgi:hypothetical protein